MEEKLLILPARPGAAGESQSGLNQAAPRIYGRLLVPPGATTAAVLIHPTSNFLHHYLLAPLAARGIAAAAFNTRYAGNDTTLLMEQAIADLGVGVRHLRERGSAVSSCSAIPAVARWWPSTRRRPSVAWCRICRTGAPSRWHQRRRRPPTPLRCSPPIRDGRAPSCAWLDPSVIDRGRPPGDRSGVGHVLPRQWPAV